jgi:hypothetical protein
MGKKPTKSGNIRLPPGSELPPDENVKVPSQVKHAAAVANALVKGQPVPPKPQPKARLGFPHDDAEIDKALEQLRAGVLQFGGSEFGVICDLAEEGARHIKSRRRGARKERENFESVTRRLEALLQAYRELPPRHQKHPTGVSTLRVLREAVIRKLGLTDNDDAFSEDSISKSMQAMRPIIRLIREGKIPASPGTKPAKRKLSEKTRQEMIAGKRALARHQTER